MSKFIADSRGIVSFTLTQIGLLIAVTILLLAIFTLFSNNDWQRKAELHNIAASFSTALQTMDTTIFENTTSFQFPEGNYNVYISTQYISITTQGILSHDITVRKQFLIKPWPQHNESPWKGKTGLHNHLNHTYGSHGTNDDPVQTKAKTYLANLWINTSKSLAANPLQVQTHRILYIDKVVIYFENGERQSYLFVYQK
jgi:hypothetical protein